MSREDATVEDRRRGPSRLSRWSGRRIATLWLVWPGSVLGIVALAALGSVVTQHGYTELRSDLTRSNLIGLTGVLIVPPTCLTVLWWRMRRRRH